MDHKHRDLWLKLATTLLVGWYIAMAVSVGRCAEVAGLRILPDQRKIEIDGRVARQDVYAEQLKGVLEYIATCDGGKIYESLFVLQPKAEDILAACQQLGLVRGKAALDDGAGKHQMPEGQGVTLWVRWKVGDKEQLRRVEDFIRDAKTTETMPYCNWTYVGSEEVEDPATGKKVPQVTVVKNIISLHHQDPGVLIQNPLPTATDQSKHHANKALLPKDGTSLTLIIEIPARGVAAAGTVSIHAFVSGRVQGVGFREFTQRSAKQLKLSGWVKNLPDGRVELMAEGDEKTLAELEKAIRTGPRPAKVEKVEITRGKATGLYDRFDVIP
jgi:acylphosphatase